MGEIKHTNNLSNTLIVSTLTLLNKQNNTIMNELSIIIDNVSSMSDAFGFTLSYDDIVFPFSPKLELTYEY